MTLRLNTSRLPKMAFDPRSPAVRFVIQGGAHVGGAACSFLATLVMVRALGQSEFGYVALGQSVLAYALVLTNFGADVHATQRTARDPSTLGQNLTAVMLVRAILVVPVLVTIGILSATGVWERGEQIAIALFSLSLFINIGYPLWAAQALERAPVIAAATFGNQLLNLILIGAAALFDGNMVYYALAKVVADLVVALVFALWVRRTHPGARVPAKEASFRVFFCNSAPLGVTSLFRTLALGSDLIILSFYAVSAVVGLYAVPYRIFMMLIALTSVFSVVMLPSFVRSAAAGKEAIGAALRQSMGMPLVAYVAILGVIAATAPFLLRVFFGADFVPGALSLQLLLVAAVANFWNRNYRMVLLATHQQVHDMRFTIVATMFGLIAKFALIPTFGIAGLAAGTAAGEIALALLHRRSALAAVRS